MLVRVGSNVKMHKVSLVQDQLNPSHVTSRDSRLIFKEIPVWSLKHMLSYRMIPLHQHQHQILNFQMTIGEMFLVQRTHSHQVTFYSVNTVATFLRVVA